VKISHKLVITIILFFLASVLATSAVVFMAYDKREMNEFEIKCEYLAEITALSCKRRVWDLDLAGIGDLAQALTHESTLYAFIVSSGDKVVFGIMKEPLTGISPDIPLSMIPLNSENYDSVKIKKMEFNGKYIGEVRLYFSTKEIKKGEIAVICFIILTFAFSGGILLVLVYYLINTQILKPINVLGLLNENLSSKFIELKSNLDEGSYEKIISINDSVPEMFIDEVEKYRAKKDEIGSLFRAFDIMKNSICTATNVIANISSKLMEVNEKLEKIVDMRTKLLKKSNYNLKMVVARLKQTQTTMVQQEKLASIGQIAAGVAHEINNPTGFIMSNMGSLSGYVNDIVSIVNAYRKASDLDNPEEVKAALEEAGKLSKKLDLDFLISDIKDIIKDSSEGSIRIKDIVDNLKNYARIDNNQSLSSININECLEVTLKLLGNELKYDLIVSKNLEDISLVQGHSGQLAQVFTNIIVNASHAIKDQKRDQPGHISVKTYDKDDFVWCEIEDDGPGIPADIMQKIFEPFFTTKEAGKGTGLGLSISFDIIKAKHNGDIWCESTEKGTKFIIKLPIHHE